MAKPAFTTDSTHLANLVALLAIEPGKVVSKSLVDAGATKVVLFAIDAGVSIREHRAPHVAVIHVVTGRVRLGVGGATHELAPNDWLLMPANAPHDVHAVEASRFLLTLVHS